MFNAVPGKVSSPSQLPAAVSSGVPAMSEDGGAGVDVRFSADSDLEQPIAKIGRIKEALRNDLKDFIFTVRVFQRHNI